MTGLLIRTGLLASGAILAIAAAAPQSAEAKDICSVPKGEWRPQGALTQKLEAAGWKIRNIKVEGGCYEVYGTDGSGKSRETHFDPRTLEPAAENHR